MAVGKSIVCSSCDGAFEDADGSTDLWLLCPHCGARTPNPLTAEQIAKKMPPLPAMRMIGTLLLVFGSLFTCGFCLMPSKSGVVLALLVAAIVVGIVLLRMDGGSRDTDKIYGMLVTLTVLGVLGVLAVLVLFAAVCAIG